MSLEGGVEPPLLNQQDWAGTSAGTPDTLDLFSEAARCVLVASGRAPSCTPAVKHLPSVRG